MHACTARPTARMVHCSQSKCGAGLSADVYRNTTGIISQLRNISQIILFKLHHVAKIK